MDDSASAYEKSALDFLARRDGSLIGAKVVEHWTKELKPGASGIELACGGGLPITRVLDEAGLTLVAVDGSPTLVAEFKKRFPHIDIHCGKVQDCNFFGRQFDFAVAIGLLFLLSESDQIALITDVSKMLNPNGRFLITAPLETGRWLDSNTGIECQSLGRDRYHRLFESAGFRVISHYCDSGSNNFYDLERIPAD